MSRFGVLEMTRLLERLPLKTGDRHLLVAPLYHSGGQAFALLQTALGATIYLRRHFEPEDTLRALSRWAIHSVFMVPTMIQRLLELSEEQYRLWPTHELRALVSGAAVFPQALRERAIARFGAEQIFDFYGATELGWVTLINGREMLERPGSVGRPLAGQQVRVVDEHGRDLPPGEVGRVFVRSEQTIRGYLRDPRASEESRMGDWFTVDDLGRLDSDGYLYIVGRARDMVISGGVNIYPAEVENELLQHPAVGDVAVIGVPDPVWGERLVAVVVPARAEVRGEELAAWARGRLSSYKVPRQWEFVDELPRTPTGKVLKRALEERFAPAVAAPEPVHDAPQA